MYIAQWAKTISAEYQLWLYRVDAFLKFKVHFAPVRDLETGSKIGGGVVSFPGSILLSD